MIPPNLLPPSSAVAAGEPATLTALCAGCRTPVAVTLEVAEGAEPVACALCDRKPKCPFCHVPMNSHEDARGACGECERLQLAERTLPR